MVIANSEIGFNEEFEELKNKLEKLRIEYTKLLLEYDELQSIILPNIEAEYMMIIGNKEHRIFSIYIKILQCKREISLYQTALNHGKTITKNEIKYIIDTEFKEYQMQLDEQLKKIQYAEKYYTAEKISDEEQKTLKKIYHKLVRKLHPDLNNNLSPKEIELWHKIVEAYKNYDWQRLYLLHDMAEDWLEKKEINRILNQETQKEQIYNLQNKMMELKSVMEDIKTKSPYIFKDLINNPELVLKKRRELDQQYAEYSENLEELKKILNNLIGK